MSRNTDVATSVACLSSSSPTIGHILKAAAFCGAKGTLVAARFGWVPLAKIKLSGLHIEVVGSYVDKWTHLGLHPGTGFFASDDVELLACLHLYAIQTDTEVQRGRLVGLGTIL